MRFALVPRTALTPCQRVYVAMTALYSCDEPRAFAAWVIAKDADVPRCDVSGYWDALVRTGYLTEHARAGLRRTFTLTRLAEAA